jgi:hypothetical protein
MKQQINELAQKEVTRKEFLTVLGIGAMSIMGLGTLTKLLSGKSLLKHHSVQGYGSSPYGG